MTTIDTIAVVVPARNESDRIAMCVTSVVRSLSAVSGRESQVVVVDDGSDDGTAAIAAATLARAGTEGAVIRTGVGQAGAARATGVRHVLASGCDPARTWVLSTDADCVVPRSWVRRHLDHAEAGELAVAGVVSLVDDGDGRRIRSAWERDYRPTIDPDGTHPYVHSANLGFRLDAYLAVGGFPLVDREEDVDLWRRLRRAGVRPVADAGISVATSARADGRVPKGFAHALNGLYGRSDPRWPADGGITGSLIEGAAS